MTTARVGRPLQRDGWAEAVFDHIPSSASDEWISKRELGRLTGLGDRQIEAAMAYIRDSHPEFPLISSRLGYRFSLDEAQVQAFRQWRARSAMTIVTRLYRGVVRPYVEATGTPSDVRTTMRQFDRLVEDLAELVS